jgi:hypothetical protein
MSPVCAAALRASQPPACTGCGRIDPVTGTGPIGMCMVLDQDDGTQIIICKRCPRAWRGRLEHTPDGGLMVVGGVPTEDPA